jgi:predicted RNA-binding Zn-ribbon protein involved in translation (DUF1610 family)
MQIDKPVYFLKKLCPICEQGSSLVLIACPECGHLAIECDEEGTFFPNPFKRSNIMMKHGEGTKSVSDKCPTCGKTEIANFIRATAEQIQNAGFTEDEYDAF